MNVQFCCLANNHAEIVTAAPTLVHYTPGLPLGFVRILGAGVVLHAESEAKATSLLAAGVNKVLVGAAALREEDVMPRLLKRFGAARLGVHLAVQRQAVSWSFDTVSNADFRVVTPSLCEPTWEVLNAEGTASGIRANDCIKDMLRCGVESVLLRADIRDDTDLNLCAGLVELLGRKLWIAPRTDSHPSIEDWIRFGQATQIALPTPLYRRRRELLARAELAGTPRVATQQLM